MRKLLRGARPLNGSIVLALAAGLLAVPLAGGTPASARSSASSSQPGEIAAFYRGRDGAPLWLSSNAGPAAQQLISLLETAQADHLNPRRYNVKGLSRAIDSARGGDPASVQRAEAMLSAAFVAYARDQRHDPGGVIYVDQQLKPTPISAAELLNAAAHEPSLSDYVQNMGWMNPIYAKLRTAIASRLYRNDSERRLLELNLERARALPGGDGRYVIVNPPAARLYMYDGGRVVDSMRVVAGRPDPVAKKKISLGLKQTTPEPWSLVPTKYSVGDIINVKVARFADFGAFVELEPGVDGLVHISQISDKRIAKPSDVLKIGETVKAKIVDIKPEEKKISLSVKDPAEPAEPVVEE
jgi:hypothetical protein